MASGEPVSVSQLLAPVSARCVCGEAASSRAALTPQRSRSSLAAARAALSDDTARGADAAHRAVGDSVRRLEAAYFSGRVHAGAEPVFPAVVTPVVRAATAPPLLAFLRPEQLPADLAPYLVLDAQGAPAAAAASKQ